MKIGMEKPASQVHPYRDLYGLPRERGYLTSEIATPCASAPQAAIANK